MNNYTADFKYNLLFARLITYQSNNTAFTYDTQMNINQTCKIDTNQSGNALILYCANNPQTDMVFT